MAFQVSPGVQVNEIDLTTIVPGVATTIGGFAGYYEWGPMDEPIVVDSPKNYRALFGSPNNQNAADWLCAENFLRYGRNLLVVRTGASGANNSFASHAGATQAQFIPNDGKDISGLPATFHARFPGNKGKSLRVEVGFAGVTAGWTYFGAFGRKPRTTDNIEQLAGSTGVADQVHVAVIDEKGLFTGNPGEILETYPNVSLHHEAKSLNGESNYIINVINRRSRYLKVSGSLDSVFTAPFSGITLSSDNYTFNGAASATSFGFSLTGGTGEFDTAQVNRYSIFGKGYQLFEDPQSIDVSLLIGGTTKTFTNVSALKSLVEKRKDCVLFLSADVDGNEFSKTDSVKAQKCVDFVNNTVTSSSYVVVDSGYKKQFDPYRQVFTWVPLNGDIAGVVARTDTTFDPWFSPAGLNRGQIQNVELLAFNPNQTYRDRIYPEGVNPVIFITGEGTVLYGDKTAQNKPSAFDRINVRRLFIVLQKAITAASKFSLFEFNDSFTRQQFRSLVEPFLRDVKARRGIFDFKVVCDDSNNTPERIDRNEFVADIYIKPSRTINFIKLNFIATRTGVDFSEVGA
jgi:hypothetical protein